MSDDVDVFEISDDELTALALAAESGSPFADDAVPWRMAETDDDPVLPDWYMPASVGRARRDWRMMVAVAIALGLVLCNAFAICVTYGFPEIP